MSLYNYDVSFFVVCVLLGVVGTRGATPTCRVNINTFVLLAVSYCKHRDYDGLTC